MTPPPLLLNSALLALSSPCFPRKSLLSFFPEASLLAPCHSAPPTHFTFPSCHPKQAPIILLRPPVHFFLYRRPPSPPLHSSLEAFTPLAPPLPAGVPAAKCARRSACRGSGNRSQRTGRETKSYQIAAALRVREKKSTPLSAQDGAVDRPGQSSSRRKGAQPYRRTTARSRVSLPASLLRSLGPARGMRN